MPIANYPLREYNIETIGMPDASGKYVVFDVRLSFRHISKEKVEKIDEFLKSQGWME